ncbi:MAG: hypothetical protein E6K91_08160 [Thaumarchaeota archaeon]|nr:MAG: hypothetical protein E6K91_08160 [Nitrososphaerota archaeon]
MKPRSAKTSVMASGAGIAAIAISLLLANMTAQVGALLPADKVGVVGSNLETTPVMTTAAGTSSSDIVLLSGTIKTSNTEDLIIMHTQECSILTNVSLKSSGGSNLVQTSTSFSQEKVWVEIDGKPVAVSSIPSPDNGSVVFCDRTFSVSTNILNQIQMLCGQQINNTCTESNFTSYINTKSTHGFNWAALNVGAGQHTIVVKAHLTVNVSGNGQASVAIGKRTLIVIPTHLAPNASI